MKLEAAKEEIRERFRLIGEIWMMCWELSDGDCRADLWDFRLESADMGDYLPGEDVEPEIDMGDTISGRCWFAGISFDDTETPMVNFVEAWKPGHKVSGSLPAVYTPSKTLEVIRRLLERYSKEIKALEQ